MAGKLGAVAVSSNASVYGELSGITGDEISIAGWHEVQLLINLK